VDKIVTSIFLGIVLLILFVLTLAIVMAVKKGSEESSERGHEMIKTVYVYLILFATLMMTIGGTVAAFMAVADIVSPPAYYQSFEQYKLAPQYKGEVPTPVNPTPTLSEAELKTRYDQMVADEKAISKGRSVNSLIKSFGWIIIPLPIFLFFQSKVKKQPV